MHIQKKILVCFAILTLIIQCKKDEVTTVPEIVPVSIPIGDGFTMLSEYNFFIGDLANLTPNTDAGVLPYDLNTALFSDYASKKRYLYVPEGSSMSFDTANVLELPVGSILIKHFYYAIPNAVDDYVETRLLIRTDDGWQPEIYEWNDAQTDAERTVIGGTRMLTVLANNQEETFNYLIPNQNQCKNCHEFNGTINPIGPTIQNLNRDFEYHDGTANQLDRWISDGILEAPNFMNIPKWPKIDDETASLNDRARAYLAVNCSSCHRLEGSAANSGLYLEYHNTMDSLSLGFWKSPVAAGDGSGGLTYVIHPGQADQSILLYRMIADAVDERMPEIGRELLDDEGITLIRDWINSL